MLLFFVFAVAMLELALGVPNIQVISPAKGAKFVGNDVVIPVEFKSIDFELKEPDGQKENGCASILLNDKEVAYARQQGVFPVRVKGYGWHEIEIQLLEECWTPVATSSIRVLLEQATDATNDNYSMKSATDGMGVQSSEIKSIDLEVQADDSVDGGLTVVSYHTHLENHPDLIVELKVDGGTYERFEPKGSFELDLTQGNHHVTIAAMIDSRVLAAATRDVTVNSVRKTNVDENHNHHQQQQQQKTEEELRQERIQKSYNVGERVQIAKQAGTKPRVMILFPREKQELVYGVERTAITYAVDGIFEAGIIWANISVNGQLVALPEVSPKNRTPNSYDEYYIDLDGMIFGQIYVHILLQDKNGIPVPEAEPADVNFEVVQDIPIEEEDLSLPCPPDVFGSQCEYHMYQNTSFLPVISHRPHDHPPLPNLVLSRASIRIFRELQTLVDSYDCKSSNIIAQIPSSGLGAQMLFLALALSKAVRTKQNMIAVGDWLYGMHSGCPSGGLNCVFVNSFTCPGHPDPTPSKISEPLNFQAPEEFSSYGVFWWRANLLEFIMHPRDELKARLGMTKKMLGWPKYLPVVAVHVRHGDWCTDVYQMNLHHGTLQPCHPFSVYLQAVRDMKAKYGVKYAYLSTNDEKIIAEAREIKDITFLSVDFDRSQFHSRWGLEQMMMHGTVDRKTVAESALIDILLLRECDFFVGGFKSQFARVSFAMMAARLGEIPPHVSVDNPWFAHDQIFLLLAHFEHKVDVEDITQALIKANWDMEAAKREIRNNHKK